MSAIAEESRYQKKYKAINGKQMAYIEEGEGDPIVFLHGNPTSSYLWRNVMPHLEGQGRLIAPDLIGMGDSQKLDHSGPDSYRFVDHREYLDELLDALNVKERVTLVIHDWGSALGFHWANRNQSSLKAIAFMEALVTPIPEWDAFPQDFRTAFEGLRSDAGEQMVLQDNIFIEGILPGGILRELSPKEMDEYRRPYVNPGEDRRPTLTFPRQVPIAGDPEDVVRIVSEYSEWLGTSDVPKLFINAEPGALIVGRARDLVRSWPNLQETTVAGIHFIQEDAPDEVGKAISNWLRERGS